MSEQVTAIASTGGPERRIVIDHARVEAVLGRLTCAYESGNYPYSLDSTRVPQDHRHMPESLELGGKEHAMFLWTSCYYMRGGIKSNVAMRRLAAMYEERPELFRAEQAQAILPKEISAELKKHGLGFQDAVSELWVENARRLTELYDGDPRNIFAGITSYEEALGRVKNDKRGGGFIGFQEKMVSMILYYLMDEKLIPEFDFPLPVDLHVLRVSIANELVRFEGYGENENVLSDELLAVLRKLYFDYARSHGISTLRLCDAVWLLSQALCGTQPGNITREPGGRGGRNGRSTILEPLVVDPNDYQQLRAYERSCGSCPIESTCAWNVPSSPYYIQGELTRRGRRIRLPPPMQGGLFSLAEASKQASPLSDPTD